MHSRAGSLVHLLPSLEDVHPFTILITLSQDHLSLCPLLSYPPSKFINFFFSLISQATFLLWNSFTQIFMKLQEEGPLGISPVNQPKTGEHRSGGVATGWEEMGQQWVQTSSSAWVWNSPYTAARQRRLSPTKPLRWLRNTIYLH